MQKAQIVRLAVVAVGLAGMAVSAIADSPSLQKKKLLPAPAKPPVHVQVAAKVATPQAPPAKAPAHVSQSAGSGAPAASAAPVLVPGKPVLVALTGDWSVFAADLNGARTCYSATQPKDTVPRPQTRLPAYVYVTSTTTVPIRHGLTIKIGIATRTNGVTANVDGHDFKLSSRGDVAYPPDYKTEADLLQAMRHGHTLMLHSTLADSAAGTDAITDSISLLGVDDSLRMIDQACVAATAAR